MTRHINSTIRRIGLTIGASVIGTTTVMAQGLEPVVPRGPIVTTGSTRVGSMGISQTTTGNRLIVATNTPTLTGLGMQSGDLIVAVNGTPVSTEAQFANGISAGTQNNQTATVTIQRGGQQQTLNVGPAGAAPIMSAFQTDVAAGFGNIGAPPGTPLNSAANSAVNSANVSSALGLSASNGTLSVSATTPALANLGLQAGDQILSVNGFGVTSPASFINDINTAVSANQQATVSVLHNGQVQSVTVNNTSLPALLSAFETDVANGLNLSLPGSTVRFARGAQLNSTNPTNLGLTMQGQNVLVGASSPALSGLGLQVGDRIISVNGQAVTSEASLVSDLNRAFVANQAMNLTIARGGQQQTINVPTTAMGSILSGFENDLMSGLIPQAAVAAGARLGPARVNPAANASNAGNFSATGTISTGTAAPTIMTGTGAPTIATGTGAPTIMTGTGAPTIATGTGAPTIQSGTTVGSASACGSNASLAGAATAASAAESSAIRAQISQELARSLSAQASGSATNQQQITTGDQSSGTAGGPFGPELRVTPSGNRTMASTTGATSTSGSGSGAGVTSEATTTDGRNSSAQASSNAANQQQITTADQNSGTAGGPFGPELRVTPSGNRTMASTTGAPSTSGSDSGGAGVTTTGTSTDASSLPTVRLGPNGPQITTGDQGSGTAGGPFGPALRTTPSGNRTMGPQRTGTRGGGAARPQGRAVARPPAAIRAAAPAAAGT